MPIHYTVDPNKGVIYTTAEGTLTGEELLAHKRALLSDPAFGPGMSELSDIREVERLEVTPESVQALAGFDREHAAVLRDHKLALLVPTDLAFGMARMYEMMTEGSTGGVMVFREEAEARAWLGLDDGE